ncbi:hypothetical protein NA57DRAFT_56952 [Rhizodiscina lignyota]|uniref:EthD domain-containing protein n=1 Tax=Rhizodiscina lignyota TaxID=1504668 RepID=A0A9P4IBM4_9PEZI|nr:hypothetical protein NA57DRAFT_56952 [Rhizodiscina lignyota]
MAPSPYLLWVNSRPTQVDDDLWVKWYIEEHVPDLVNHHVATRGSFYRELVPEGFALGGTPHPRKYLALYQTEIEEPLKTQKFIDIRKTSEMFPKDKTIHANGEFNGRNYKLIQDYDPENIGEKPTKFVLTAEMNPKDEADFEKWYLEEHLEMLHKVPGHRRSQRYVIGPKVPGIGDVTEAPKYLAVHEYDSLDPFINNAPEVVKTNGTPWTKKQIAESNMNAFRMFELVKPIGY